MDEKRHENDLNKKEMSCSAHCYFDTSVCGSRFFFLFVSRSASRYGDIRSTDVGGGGAAAVVLGISETST